MTSAALGEAPARLVHLAYRIGALVDAVMVVPLLVPSVAGAMFGIDGFAPGSDYRYAAAVSAALMAGWTALLIWGDRDPVGRRGVLLLTVCPVLLGLVAAGVYAMGSGLVRPVFIAPMFVIQVGLAVLFLIAYRRAGTSVGS
ncbi:hypothetical protein [Mycobacterium sp. Marseille-P9652]|uniref:hypothetical protein n=1 Tax=Mycobacterium sp. Marseille-P9652 TaxID=2654950 RepID=UPI0012E725A2|nr:hypothetical protein [Mycobacterium sp. Marseille-P9652]